MPVKQKRKHPVIKIAVVIFLNFQIAVSFARSICVKLILNAVQ